MRAARVQHCTYQRGHDTPLRPSPPPVGGRGYARRMTQNSHRCLIVPPYLLEAIAQASDERFALAAEAARASLMRDEPVRVDRLHAHERQSVTTRPASAAAARESTTPGKPRRSIADARGIEQLPGTTVRNEEWPPSADPSVNEAYDGLGSTYALFWQAFHRDSIDGANMQIDATVHYGIEYDNAFWNGERMVFGDGDGQVFQRFTSSLSVIGHELTHGVTEHTAGLKYQGQSGALNEHLSDVFGALTEQFARGQQAHEATWLIGAELFTSEVQGRALRDMRNPGTAYDDDVLGKDPQPAHMRDFIITTDDNGGVHLNSGIPNRAFTLAALALGGEAHKYAGTIWYDTLSGGTLAPDANFARFASLTVASAERLFGRESPERRAVLDGWIAVGVLAQQPATA